MHVRRNERAHCCNCKGRPLLKLTCVLLFLRFLSNCAQLAGHTSGHRTACAERSRAEGRPVSVATCLETGAVRHICHEGSEVLILCLSCSWRFNMTWQVIALKHHIGMPKVAR